MESLENGQVTTIYPHGGVAVLKIMRVWGIVALITVGALVAQRYLPPHTGNLLNYAAIPLWLGAVVFAAQQFLHYSNTYLVISDEAMVYRKGWIPNITDTIFWVNIKDVNTSRSLGEGLLGAGTIILIVAIRNLITTVTIPYIPEHEMIAGAIRSRVGRLNTATQQVTYT